MALGFDGEYYNINADEMAAACAIACHADALVFLTDVPGVKGANGEVLRWLSIDQIAEMAKSAVISGGMLPKLSACREAFLNGVKRVRILPAEAAGFPARPVQLARGPRHRSDGGLRRFLKTMKLERDSRRGSEAAALDLRAEPGPLRRRRRRIHHRRKRAIAISICSAASASTRSATTIRRLWKRLPARAARSFTLRTSTITRARRNWRCASPSAPASTASSSPTPAPKHGRAR